MSTISKYAQKLQVLRNSLLVIDWMRLKRAPKNIVMPPLYKELSRLTDHFQIYTHHIYREINLIANLLSKQRLWWNMAQMETGWWQSHWTRFWTTSRENTIGEIPRKYVSNGSFFVFMLDTCKLKMLQDFPSICIML